MFSWHAIPFVRIAFPFAIGIYVGYLQSEFSYFPLILFLGFVALLFLFEKIFEIRNRYRLRISNGIILNICAFSIAWFFTINYSQLRDKNHYSKIDCKNNLLIEIDEVVSIKSNSTKAYANVLLTIDSHGNAFKSKGKILVYFNKSLSQININERFIIDANLKEIEAPLNIGDFDYKSYLSMKDIHHSVWLNKYNTLNAGNSGFDIWQYADELKNKCNEIVRKYLKTKEQYGVAEALLIGYKDDISTELTDTFARTGTLHVLAVSGMHVGIIFMILDFIGRMFKNLKYSRLLNFAFIMIGLWTYAMICGLGASILRATIMFSILSAGKLINRNANSLNLLFLSAFLLMFSNPFVLFDPGFQLSFTAVFGILCTYKPLSRTLKFKYKISNSIWELICMSISAQTFTFPISIYYFHQFPNLFLLANIIIIPLTSIILFGLIALISISSFAIISKPLSMFIGYLIDLNNIYADWISNISWSVTDNLLWSKHTIFGVYILITFILIYFKTRKFKYINLSLSVILAMLILPKVLQKSSMSTKQLIEYKTRYDKVHLCILGDSAFVVGDSIQISDKNSIKKGIKNTLLHYGIKSIILVPENKMFVTTNFLHIPKIGFQFFDTIVTHRVNDQNKRHKYEKNNDRSKKEYRN